MYISKIHIQNYRNFNDFYMEFHKGLNVIIGANSTVTHDIPDNMVYAGTPARALCTLEEYIEKERERMKTSPHYGEEYTLRKKVPFHLRIKQREELREKTGYIV